MSSCLRKSHRQSLQLLPNLQLRRLRAPLRLSVRRLNLVLRDLGARLALKGQRDQSDLLAHMAQPDHKVLPDQQDPLAPTVLPGRREPRDLKVLPGHKDRQGRKALLALSGQQEQLDLPDLKAQPELMALPAQLEQPDQ